MTTLAEAYGDGIRALGWMSDRIRYLGEQYNETVDGLVAEQRRVQDLQARIALLEAVREAAKAYMNEADDHFDACKQVAMEKALAASEPPKAPSGGAQATQTTKVSGNTPGTLRGD